MTPDAFLIVRVAREDHWILYPVWTARVALSARVTVCGDTYITLRRGFRDRYAARRWLTAYLRRLDDSAERHTHSYETTE